MDEKQEKILQKVLSAQSKEELSEAYDEWAEQYDEDLIESMNYVAPAIASKLLGGQLEAEEVRILDAGCGTGLVGQCLNEQGYKFIDGLDYSNSMLIKADEKKVYRQLLQGDLTAKLNIPDKVYDAVISVGTFTCGHVGPEALEELVRITKPGGCICFTVRDKAWHDDGYRKKIDELKVRGDWLKIAEETVDYIKKEGSTCKACVYRVIN